MIDAIWNRLTGGPRIEAHEEDEPVDDEEDEDDDEVEYVTKIQEATQIHEMEIECETLEIVWNDGSDSTERIADKWEKEDGDYVLYTTHELHWVSGSAFDPNAGVQPVWEVNIRLSADSVKAIDVVGTRTRTLEYERTYNKRVQVPKSDHEEDAEDA